jgi:hypothetical protein
MRSFWMTLMAALLLSVTVVGTFPVHAEEITTPEGKATVKLTDQQKNELAALHKEILEKRKEVISKYVKYGVITEEKGKKIVSHLDKHYEKLEKNGFIPHWDHSKHKKHKHSHK